MEDFYIRVYAMEDKVPTFPKHYPAIAHLFDQIIDSILDYSKLEASALKLEYSAFPVENIIADCMELLLPMAAKKLDLSFDIEPDVPPCRCLLVTVNSMTYQIS